MKVEQLLKQSTDQRRNDVQTIAPKATVQEAANKLAAHKIGILVVCDDEEHVLGIFSERDLIHSISIHGKNALDHFVETEMTSDVQVCETQDDVQSIMNAMAKGHFRHMPVLEFGTLHDVISTTDILKYLADNVTADDRILFWSKIAWV